MDILLVIIDLNFKHWLLVIKVDRMFDKSDILLG